MAIRNIIEIGDPVLTKVCKPVTEDSQRIHVLLDDMEETMIDAQGVGLAAPQVGVMRRAIVVRDGEKILKLINPEIISSEGAVVGSEGCLSIPEVYGDVERPVKIVVKALNSNFEPIEFEARDFTARVLCHEIDHLNGELFVNKATNLVYSDDLGDS